MICRPAVLLAACVVSLLASDALAQINVRAGTARIQSLESFQFQNGGIAGGTVTGFIQLPEIERVQVKTTVDGTFIAGRPIRIGVGFEPDFTPLADAMKRAQENQLGLVFVITEPNAEPIEDWGPEVALASTYAPFIELTAEEAAYLQLPTDDEPRDGYLILMTDRYGNRLDEHAGRPRGRQLKKLAKRVFETREAMKELNISLAEDRGRALKDWDAGRRSRAIQRMADVASHHGYPAAVAAKIDLDGWLSLGRAELAKAVALAGDESSESEALRQIASLRNTFAGTPLEAEAAAAAEAIVNPAPATQPATKAAAE